MEAAGVEPASVLQTRKLLTLRTDKKDKTDTSPITAYKMHTKSLGPPASILRATRALRCYHATTNRRDLFSSKDRARPMQIITTECLAPKLPHTSRGKCDYLLDISGTLQRTRRNTLRHR